MRFPVAASDIRTVAVVGCGFVGHSWAHIFSRNELETYMYDADARQLERGHRRLCEQLDVFETTGLIDEEAKRDALNRLHLCEDLAQAVSGADWVQECVPEDLGVKQRLFAEMDGLTSDGTILASSSSSLIISEVAALMKTPDRCIGVHPTNPPHVVPLVEIIKAEKTASEVVVLAREFMTGIGQSPIVVQKEVPGYVLNRLQSALVREAVSLARNGVASVPDIDRCLSEGLGLRWAFTGPYLVEELNGDDVGRCFKAYADYYERMWASLSELNDVTRLEECDIDLAVEGVAQLLDVSTHEDLLAWRDHMVLATRHLKDGNRGYRIAESKGYGPV